MTEEEIDDLEELMFKDCFMIWSEEIPQCYEDLFKPTFSKDL